MVSLCFSTVILTFIVTFPYETEGHAYLAKPPSRSSMWRYGYDTPVNYEDNQLFCGGVQAQYKENGGKCGICGDNYADPSPRNNEAGGKYGLGIISKTYEKNSVIDITVDLTANHLGYFEFRLCPNNDVTKVATQECLDQYLLELADGTTRYQIPVGFGYSGLLHTKAKLPKDLTCSQCVLQFHYNTANSWGECEDGTGAIGCGDQEVFRGCADIAIVE